MRLSVRPSSFENALRKPGGQLKSKIPTIYERKNAHKNLP